MLRCCGTLVEPGGLPLYLRAITRPMQQAGGTAREDEWASTASLAGANLWLQTVLDDAPYATPAMSVVLSQFLTKTTANA